MWFSQIIVAVGVLPASLKAQIMIVAYLISIFLPNLQNLYVSIQTKYQTPSDAYEFPVEIPRMSWRFPLQKGWFSSHINHLRNTHLPNIPFGIHLWPWKLLAEGFYACKSGGRRHSGSRHFDSRCVSLQSSHVTIWATGTRSRSSRNYFSVPKHLSGQKGLYSTGGFIKTSTVGFMWEGAPILQTKCLGSFGPVPLARRAGCIAFAARN